MNYDVLRFWTSLMKGDDNSILNQYVEYQIYVLWCVKFYMIWVLWVAMRFGAVGTQIDEFGN